MTIESAKPIQPVTGVAEKLAAERRRKRWLIGHSLWPKARLAGEILYQQMDQERTFSQASALTYKTLFSLLPIFVLSLLILSTISEGGGKNALDRVVQRMIFEELSLDKLPVIDDQGQPMTKIVHGQERPLMLSDFIEPLIERAKGAVTNPATGLVAFAVLVYGGISLMIVIEGTFNHIYGAVKPRRWVHRLILYWCVLTLGPIGVAATIGLGNSTYMKATTYVGAGWMQWLLAPAQVISGITVSFVLVFLLFKLIPNAQVRWKSALVGALLAAVSWEICKWGFGVYVQRALRASWYGSLALIPFFMLWIYLTWSAILIGLHVAYMHQFYPILKRQYFFTRMGVRALSDVRWVLSLGVLLCRRFRQGKTTQIDEAAELLILPSDATGQLLEALSSAGIVHATRGGAYALARPAGSVTAFDLLLAARSYCQIPPELAPERPPPGSYPTSKAMGELESIEAAWAKNHTLAELAGEPAEWVGPGSDQPGRPDPLG